MWRIQRVNKPKCRRRRIPSAFLCGRGEFIRNNMAVNLFLTIWQLPGRHMPRPRQRRWITSLPAESTWLLWSRGKVITSAFVPHLSSPECRLTGALADGGWNSPAVNNAHRTESLSLFVWWCGGVEGGNWQKLFRMWLLQMETIQTQWEKHRCVSCRCSRWEFGCYSSAVTTE